MPNRTAIGVVLCDGVFDDAVGELRVRYGKQFVVERPNTGDAETDILDDAGVSVPLDPVADSERLVGVDEHAGDEVRNKSGTRSRSPASLPRRWSPATAGSPVFGHPEGDGDGDDHDTDADDLLQRLPSVGSRSRDLSERSTMGRTIAFPRM